jgi:hypothetical protein
MEWFRAIAEKLEDQKGSVRTSRKKCFYFNLIFKWDLWKTRIQVHKPEYFICSPMQLLLIVTTIPVHVKCMSLKVYLVMMVVENK